MLYLKELELHLLDKLFGIAVKNLYIYYIAIAAKTY